MQLAKSWTLPISIMSGLTATYAIPWNFQDIDGYLIFTTIIPLITQAVLAATSAVLAFMGKSAWLPIQIAVTAIAAINCFGFSFGFWGVELPKLPLTLLVIASFALIPVLVWGRKSISGTNAENGHKSSEESIDNSNW